MSMTCYERLEAAWNLEEADRMLEHAPCSFLLTKLMWKAGESPWEG